LSLDSQTKCDTGYVRDRHGRDLSKYAAYLNLIEPWWKVLRSLALAGRRFDTWDDDARPFTPLLIERARGETQLLVKEVRIGSVRFAVLRR